jgi:hypothetical protein
MPDLFRVSACRIIFYLSMSACSYLQLSCAPYVYVVVLAFSCLLSCPFFVCLFCHFFVQQLYAMHSVCLSLSILVFFVFPAVPIHGFVMFLFVLSSLVRRAVVEIRNRRRRIPRCGWVSKKTRERVVLSCLLLSVSACFVLSCRVCVSLGLFVCVVLFSFRSFLSLDFTSTFDLD